MTYLCQNIKQMDCEYGKSECKPNIVPIEFY